MTSDKHASSRTLVTSGQHADRRADLFDHLQDAVVVFHVLENGERGPFIDVNKAACKRYGYTRNEMLAMSVKDLDAPEFRPEVPPAGVRYDNDSTVVFEVLHVDRNGNRLPGEVTARRFMLDDKPTICGTVRDISARKRAQEELKRAYDELESRVMQRTRALEESERRFRSIVHSSPLGMMFFQMDDTGRLLLTDSNPAADTITGIATSALYGLPLEEAFPDIAASDLAIHFRAAASHGISRQTDQFEYSDGPASGIYEVYAFQTSPGSMAAVFKDITARRAAEMEREKARRTMQAVMDSLPQRIYATDLDTFEMLFANKQLKESFGNDLLGGKCWEVFRNRASRCPDCRVDMVVENGFLAWERNRDNKHYLNMGSVIEWIDGRRAKLQVTTDVTELTEAREAALEAEGRYRKLVQDTVIGMFRSTMDGKLEDANPALASIFGYDSPEEMLEEVEDTRFLYADPSVREIHLSKARLSQNALIHHEARMLRRTGEKMWVREYARLQPDTSGEPTYIEGFLMDITPQKTLEHGLRKEKERAESANLAKSAFLANMSHEIRTPLNGVLGMLQLMRLAETDRERDKYVTTAIASSRSLLALISDILDLSRVEAGRMDFQAGHFQLREVLGSIRDTFRQTAEEKGVQLGWAVHPGTPEILSGDAGRLRQILFNLVGNGIKFTDQGSVFTNVCAAGPVRNNRVRLLFSVADTGVGIPDKMVKAVFEPFTQADGSFTRKFQGAGLGLSIVRRLVEAMGGNLSLENTPNRGTVFHFTLPLELGEEKQLPPSPFLTKKSAPQTRPLHLLLAEDDRINQLTAVKFLEKLGHTVAVADNGTKALQALENERFDVLLLDVQMPEMDGLQVTRTIRENRNGTLPEDIPILGVTAHAMAGDHELFLTSGMNGCLTKPLDLNELGNALAHLMSDPEK